MNGRTMTDPGHDEPLHEPAEPLGAGPYDGQHDDEYDDDGFRIGCWRSDDGDDEYEGWDGETPAPTPVHPAELLPGDVLSDLADDDSGTGETILRRVLRVEAITHPDDGRPGWLVLCDGIVPLPPGDDYDDGGDETSTPMLPDYSAAALNLDPAIHRRRLYIDDDGAQPVLMLAYRCPMHLAFTQWARLTLRARDDAPPAELELAAHAAIAAVVRPRLGSAADDPAAERLAVSTGSVTGITEITMSLDTDPAPLLAFLDAAGDGTTAPLGFQAWSGFPLPLPAIGHPARYGILALVGARPATVETPSDPHLGDAPAGVTITWRIDPADHGDPFAGSTLAAYTDQTAPQFVTDNPLPFPRRPAPPFAPEQHGGWGGPGYPDASAA